MVSCSWRSEQGMCCIYIGPIATDIRFHLISGHTLYKYAMGTLLPCSEGRHQTDSHVNYCCLWSGSLPYGSVCQLGLREGRLPDAEVRGHQVQGGARAAWHPLHSLQRAAQCLHISRAFPSRADASVSNPGLPDPPTFWNYNGSASHQRFGGWLRNPPNPPLCC